MKTDFHTHILPGVDDGAKTVEMSLGMLKSLEEQQVDTVVLTPHFYSHREPMSEFCERRKAAFEQLQAALPHGHIKLRLGAEVYFSDYLFNCDDLSDLCVNGTRVLLLELPFDKTIDRRFADKIYRLIADFNVTPVLAHIERYPSILRSISTINALWEIGCRFQVNLSSFTVFGKRRLLSLVKKGYISAIGTDAHNLTSRPPVYDEGYQILAKALSHSEADILQTSMTALLDP